jgi:hypothetical protein
VVLDDQTIQRIEDQNIELIVIGVWTLQWGPILEWTDRFGNPLVTQYQWQTVISTLWEEILASVATQWWWSYERLEAIDDIDSIISTVSSSQSSVIWWWFEINGWWYDGLLLMLISLILFVGYGTMSMRKKDIFSIS